MPLFFLGTREWRNRQTRTVQVRVPVMEWGFNSPLAHDETADPLRICGFCFPWLLLVAPLVFRAPEAPAAVCAGGRRPAREPSALRASLGASPRSPARPRRRPPAPRQIPPAPSTPAALRRWSVAGCVGSKPGQAPPPPTGTAADPSGPLHTGGAWSLMCYWVRCFEARPGPVPRRVPYPQFRMQFPDTCSSSLSEKPGISAITFQSMKCAWGNCMRICADQAPPPPAGTAAWSSGPSGALHTGGAWSLICGSARRIEARPGPAAAHGHRSRVPLLPVGVTGVSRVEFLGCSGACCYKRRQSKVFFVWLSVPLLQTSLIRGLFR